MAKKVGEESPYTIRFISLKIIFQFLHLQYCNSRLEFPGEAKTALDVVRNCQTEQEGWGRNLWDVRMYTTFDVDPTSDIWPELQRSICNSDNHPLLQEIDCRLFFYSNLRLLWGITMLLMFPLQAVDFMDYSLTG